MFRALCGQLPVDKDLTVAEGGGPSKPTETAVCEGPWMVAGAGYPGTEVRRRAKALRQDNMEMGRGDGTIAPARVSRNDACGRSLRSSLRFILARIEAKVNLSAHPVPSSAESFLAHACFPARCLWRHRRRRVVPGERAVRPRLHGRSPSNHEPSPASHGRAPAPRHGPSIGT